MVRNSARKSWIKAIIWMLIQRNHLPEHACTSSTPTMAPVPLHPHDFAPLAGQVVLPHHRIRSGAAREMWKKRLNASKKKHHIFDSHYIEVHEMKLPQKKKYIQERSLYCSNDQLYSPSLSLSVRWLISVYCLPVEVRYLWMPTTHSVSVLIPLWSWYSVEWHKTVAVASRTLSKTKPSGELIVRSSHNF